MPQRDSEGYILLSECDSQSSLLPATNSPVISYISTLQQHLSLFYGSIITFIEEYLFTRQTCQSIAKYLLYPFLSGSFSASIAYIRHRRR
jgi:hypothetical protein